MKNADKGIYAVDDWMQFVLSDFPQSIVVFRETAKRLLDINVNFKLIMELLMLIVQDNS